MTSRGTVPAAAPMGWFAQHAPPSAPLPAQPLTPPVFAPDTIRPLPSHQPATPFRPLGMSVEQLKAIEPTPPLLPSRGSWDAFRPRFAGVEFGASTTAPVEPEPSGLGVEDAIGKARGLSRPPKQAPFGLADFFKPLISTAEGATVLSAEGLARP